MKNKEFVIFCPSESCGNPIPLTEHSVQAGFPSPADGLLSETLNLHELVVKHPAATFFVRVAGDSMRDAGINSGDILVVDRSLEPRDGKIVVAILNGEFTVKTIRYHSNGLISLLAAHSAYEPIDVAKEADFQVWGVVSYVIHKT